MTQREIAETLKVSVPNISYHEKRAIKKITEHLAKENKNDATLPSEELKIDTSETQLQKDFSPKRNHYIKKE